MEDIFCENVTGYLEHKKIVDLVNKHPIFQNYRFAYYKNSNFYIVTGYDNGYDGKRNFIGFTNSKKNSQKIFEKAKLVTPNQLLEILNYIDPKELERPFFTQLTILMELWEIR